MIGMIGVPMSAPNHSFLMKKGKLGALLFCDIPSSICIHASINIYMHVYLSYLSKSVYKDFNLSSTSIWMPHMHVDIT